MAKKKWGQNFLIHQSVVDEILQAANLQKHENVLEVGPGQGMLTRSLLMQAQKVTAVEIDPELCDLLKKNIWQKEFTLVEKDVMDMDVQALSELVDSPVKVVANLPYNIATPLMLKMFSVRKKWQSLTLMVQLEVAQRFCATPNSGKIYGPLSLVGALGFERKVVCEIPPSAFRPAPKVTSAVLHLVPKDSGWTGEKEDQFLKWSHKLFQQRRKTLINGIKNHFPDWYRSDAEKLKQDLDRRRPETLEFEEWAKLFDDFLGH